MIYNGEEACNAKRLEFFEKDPIDWKQAQGCALDPLLTDLIAFRKANPALDNAPWGGRMTKVDSDRPEQLFAWVRMAGGNKVLGLFNLSDKPVTATLSNALPAGDYREFRTGAAVSIRAGDTVDLPPWGYRLLAGAAPAQAGAGQ